MQSSREQARLGLQRLCRGLLVNIVALGISVPVLDLISATQPTATEEISKPDADILIVGAGIAGLSAALELARGGTSVAVIDAFSVFGGHAVVSNGAVSMGDTPLQRSMKIKDSPEIALRDFIDWGKDANVDWVHYYVQHSRDEVYDWLTQMGVVFESVIPHDGNSVARLHLARGKGLGLVSPIYREALRTPNVSFLWNTKMERLLIEGNRIAGVAAENTRTQTKRELRAKVVILATGGVQSNLTLVREFWPKDLPSPARLLLGGGRYATGSGHEAAKQIGAVWYNMDHQWNYALGLPDPRDPTDLRGLASFNPDSIWVNVRGKRFVNEFAGAKDSLPALLAQEGATYWSIFDEAGKSSFKVTLAGWEDFRRIESVIFSNPELVKTAANLTELSVKVGLSASSLSETVNRYNSMIEEGTDKDFGRFSPKTSPKPKKIERPPFYAVQFFPITRKSMGGVKVDLSCRVLDRQQQPIPGLYAIGEVTGFGGINGKAALEGTFLGPGVVMGRIAARSALGSLGNQKPQLSASSKKIPPVPVQLGVSRQEVCANCHNISEAVAASRNGYWHFEMSHRMALERKMDCLSCHGELFPYRPETHRINRLAQSKICASCHGGSLG